MKNTIDVQAVQHEECEDHWLRRMAFAVGAGLVLLGSAMLHSERWTMGGVALIAISYLY
jgi:hypothetical protein